MWLAGITHTGQVHTIESRGRRFTVRRATEDDLPAIVALLADDVLGAARESADLEPYRAAFAQIDADPAQLLVVVADEERRTVGTLQLTLIPGLSRGGTLRLQIEAVRIAPQIAGTGVGTALLDWAHAYGRARGARLAQLTTDKSRGDAQRFYSRLGYAASHEGMKLPL